MSVLGSRGNNFFLPLMDVDDDDTMYDESIIENQLGEYQHDV